MGACLGATLRYAAHDFLCVTFLPTICIPHSPSHPPSSACASQLLSELLYLTPCITESNSLAVVVSFHTPSEKAGVEALRVRLGSTSLTLLFTLLLLPLLSSPLPSHFLPWNRKCQVRRSPSHVWRIVGSLLLLLPLLLLLLRLPGAHPPPRLLLCPRRLCLPRSRCRRCLPPALPGALRHGGAGSARGGGGKRDPGGAGRAGKREQRQQPQQRCGVLCAGRSRSRGLRTAV